MGKYATIDIGGTNTRMAIFDETQKRIDYKKIDTNINDMNATISIIVDFLKTNKVKDVAMAIPGPANYRTGQIFATPNLPGWRNQNVFNALRDKINLDTLVAENDANLMALAQHHHFRKSKEDITQFFTVSTGLGAGLVIDNKIFVGARGYAQEVAQAPVSWNKDDVGGGFGEGAVEYFASGNGLLARSQKHGITKTAELFKEYKNGTKFAIEIVEEGIEALANLIAVSAALINPSCMVFDGSVARNNKWYVEKAIQKSKSRMFEQQFNSIDFKFSELDDDAALLGAYHYLQHHMTD